MHTFQSKNHEETRRKLGFCRQNYGVLLPATPHEHPGFLGHLWDTSGNADNRPKSASLRDERRGAPLHGPCIG